jgi:lysophospholipase L1-like esterase
MLIAVAVLADRLGIGQAGSVGIGQLLLAAAGFILVAAGWSGRRFFSAYTGASVLLLNTLILLGMIEVGAIALSRLSTSPQVSTVDQISYYQDQPWASQYWREARTSEVYRYEPYVLWRHRPFEGEWVGYDAEGRRKTPGPPCEEATIQVFTFGGSTMIGWGSPDGETISGHLARLLDERFDGAVCVENKAEDGYVSTQGVITLILELQTGQIPDVVVFYDGVNDVLAAYESGSPRTHVTLAQIAAKFDQEEHPLLKWYRSSRHYTMLSNWMTRNAPRPSAMPTDDPSEAELAQAIAETYLVNYRIVKSLAEEYGFDFIFFLQPHLGLGAKPLTDEEAGMLEAMGPDWPELARQTYSAIESLSDTDRVILLTDAFDGLPEQVWIDEAGHVTPVGNESVARAMLPTVSAAAATRIEAPPDQESRR